MTINEAVSLLRNSLKEHTDTTNYKDAYLWALFSAGLAKVKEAKLRAYGYSNPNYYHTFCIELKEGLTHDCSCVENGCPALVSVHKLPDYLTTNTRSTLSLFKLNGQSIAEIDNYDYYESFSKYDEAYKNKPLYYIDNGKIIIPNTQFPKVVRVKAVWKDILDWENLQYCTEDNVTTDCDIYNIPIGIDPGMEFEVLKNVFFVLNLPLKLREDNTADNNSEIK